MSINYYLRFDTNLKPEKLLELLLSDPSAFSSSNGNLVSENLIVKAGFETEIGSSLIMEYFGFQPKVNISFWMNTSGKDYQKGVRLMIKSVSLLLSKISGDAILLRENEQILLQRINGNLIVNKDLWSNWFPSENFLAEIAEIYALRSLPSPLV